MMSVDAIVMERYVKKQKEGLEKLNFTKECIVMAAISLDFVCGMIAAAAIKKKKKKKKNTKKKKSKMANGGFPRSEGKQGEFLLIVSNDDCIIK